MQTKLAVNKPGDGHEREADRVAERLMNAPEPSAREDEGLQTMRGPAGDAEEIETPPIVREVLRAPGQPLDEETRAFMEPRFGHDFSRVRVHVGGEAERSARALHARAYTVGNDIVFGAGRFASETQEGRRLLAHELTHVVQQSGAGPRLARWPNEKQMAALGAELESLELDKWKETLEAQGYEVYTRKQFGKVDWLAKAFSDKRARPDLVAVNRAERKVLVGDVTAGPWSQAALKPGDVRKLPHDTGGEIETKHHLEKTTDNARQASRHLPKELKGFTVTAQDRWWQEGGYSVEVTVAKGTTAPKPTGGAPLGPTFTGGVGGMVGAGGGGGGQGVTIPSEPAAGTREVRAETGAPLEPVVEATPGFEPAAGAGLGNAIQLLQAKMVANLEQDEVEKFEARLAKLQPKIEAFFSKGYSVQLLLIVEKPNTFDVLCAAGAFCDQSQLVYFHDLYINYVESIAPVMTISPNLNTSQTTISAPGGRDGYVPYSHEGGSIIDEDEIPFLSARDSIHHCEFAKLTLYPPEPFLPLKQSRPPAQTAKPKPRLDDATKKALAAAPSEVFLVSANIVQEKTAYEVIPKLKGNASFGEVHELLGGGFYQKRTLVSYRNNLDKPRAEALAEIIRAAGVETVYTDLSGDGEAAPGFIQVFFGTDAEKK